MFKLTVHNGRWRIHKDCKIAFSGIGTADQAFAIARVYGIVLTEFSALEYLKAA